MCQILTERGKKKWEIRENQIVRFSELWAFVLKTKSSCSVESVYWNIQSTATRWPNMESLPNAIDSLPTRLPWRC